LIDYAVSIMEAQPDFRKLLELLNEHEVEYVVVGGYAVAYHGAPRYTGDLDVYVRPTNQNATRIMSALQDFGFGELDLEEDDFTTTDSVVQLGVPPVRIDLITSIDGVSWETVWQNRVPGVYGDISAPFIGKHDLVVNKRASGRKTDLADVEALGERQ
jgi:hypothetical protein